MVAKRRGRRRARREKRPEPGSDPNRRTHQNTEADYADREAKSDDTEAKCLEVGEGAEGGGEEGHDDLAALHARRQETGDVGSVEEKEECE